MARLPKKIKQKLLERRGKNALRTLHEESPAMDFTSNDYLGLAGNEMLFDQASEWVKQYGPPFNGSTGSRLLSGQHPLAEKAEERICDFHGAASALLYTSGYMANVGLLSAIPQKGDVILYDQLSHASIREGIRLSMASGYKYAHLGLADLEKKIQKFRVEGDSDIYIVTESVFSMDGDSPDLLAMVNIAQANSCYLIVDEAHAGGIVGNRGQGMVAALGLQDRIFATLITFGKGFGAHGAAVLGTPELRTALLNFSKSQIYTTALPPHTLATLLSLYDYLGSVEHTTQMRLLRDRITLFKREIQKHDLHAYFRDSESQIQACILAGNDYVKKVSAMLRSEGFDVRPILSPTVREGEERLRICLHSFNQAANVVQLVRVLKKSIQNARKSTGIYNHSSI